MRALAWLDTKDVLTTEQVSADLRVVLARRFPPSLLLRRADPDEWLIYYPPRPVFGVSVSLSKRGHRLFFQKGGTDWSAWALYVVRSELGVLHKGECGDEGVDQTWAPDPMKWPDYETFVRDTHRRTITRNGLSVVETLLNDVPSALHSSKS